MNTFCVQGNTITNEVFLRWHNQFLLLSQWTSLTSDNTFTSPSSCLCYASKTWKQAKNFLIKRQKKLHENLREKLTNNMRVFISVAVVEEFKYGATVQSRHRIDYILTVSDHRRPMRVRQSLSVVHFRSCRRHKIFRG